MEKRKHELRRTCIRCRRRVVLNRNRWDDYYRMCKPCVKATLKDGESGQHALHRLFADVNRRKRIESIYTLIDDFATQTFGSWELLVKEWVYLINDPKTTPSFRIKSMSTLLYLATCADYCRVELESQSSPAELLRKLHSRDQLVPAIQEMFLEGTISIDDIDPPPANIDTAHLSGDADDTEPLEYTVCN